MGLFSRKKRVDYSDSGINIYIVCTANITRSAFIQRALQRKLDQEGIGVSPIKVKSAGCRAQKGNHADLGMTMLARQRGLDLSPHKSQPFERKHSNEAEIVLTLEEWHRNDLRAKFPGLMDKLFTILEFNHAGEGLGDISIPDPTGKDPEEYMAFLETATREVDLIFENLVKRGVVSRKTPTA